jgi:hypothetical protein
VPPPPPPPPPGAPPPPRNPHPLLSPLHRLCLSPPQSTGRSTVKGFFCAVPCVFGQVKVNPAGAGTILPLTSTLTTAGGTPCTSNAVLFGCWGKAAAVGQLRYTTPATLATSCPWLTSGNSGATPLSAQSQGLCWRSLARPATLVNCQSTSGSTCAGCHHAVVNRCPLPRVGVPRHHSLLPAAPAEPSAEVGCGQLGENPGSVKV